MCKNESLKCSADKSKIIKKKNKNNCPSVPVPVPSSKVYESLASPRESKLDNVCCSEFQVWKLAKLCVCCGFALSNNVLGE